MIKFDPWWFSGKENLLDKLLKELKGQEPWLYSPLRSLLKSLEKQASADNAWLKSKLEVFALLLASGVSAALNPTLNWFGNSVSSAIKPWLESGQAALLVLGLFWLIKLGLGAAISKLAPPEGFDARKKKLEELLKKDHVQRVVFVDDLDRLPVDELQETFRVIKSVANFPNVVYVLAYDRVVVSAALDKFHPERGEQFLEKIVQMPIALPAPTSYIKEKAYREILSSVPAMYQVLQESTDSYSQNNYGWRLICAGFISNARQAKRLRDVINTQYNQNLGIHPLFFLFLEALYLNSVAAGTALCQALCKSQSHPYYNSSTNWGQVFALTAFQPEMELKKLQEWVGTYSQKEKPLTGIPKQGLECIAFFTGFPGESTKQPFSLIKYKTPISQHGHRVELEERSRVCTRYLQKKLGEDELSKQDIEFMLFEIKNQSQLFIFMDAHVDILLHQGYSVHELEVYLLNRAMEQEELLEKACGLARLVAEAAEGLYFEPETDKYHAYRYFFQKSFRGLQSYFSTVNPYGKRVFDLTGFSQGIQESSPLFVLDTPIEHTTPNIYSICETVLSKYPFSSFERPLSKYEGLDISPCVTVLYELFLHSSYISSRILDEWLSGLPDLKKLNENQKGHLHAWILKSLEREGESSKLIVHSKLSQLIPSVRDTLQKTTQRDLLAVLDKLAPEAKSNP